MANTYSQIYLQFVFAVHKRESVIPREHKEELHKYITSVVQRRDVKMLAIHCMPDHAHIFVGCKATLFIPDFVKEVKVKSNEFISSKTWTRSKFKWQEGYGVFSYGHSQINKVCQYIFNQEAHHKKKTFKQEYHHFLEKFNVQFDEQYLFSWIEEI
jgi:putative transposase